MSRPMKAYLYLSGTIFSLIALRHVVATYNNWSAPNPDFGSVFGAALIGICAGALGVSAFRLVRRATTALPSDRPSPIDQ
jgi:hypothetical protein